MAFRIGILGVLQALTDSIQIESSSFQIFSFPAGLPSPPLLPALPDLFFFLSDSSDSDCASYLDSNIWARNTDEIKGRVSCTVDSNEQDCSRR